MDSSSSLSERLILDSSKRPFSPQIEFSEKQFFILTNKSIQFSHVLSTAPFMKIDQKPLTPKLVVGQEEHYVKGSKLE